MQMTILEISTNLSILSACRISIQFNACVPASVLVLQFRSIRPHLISSHLLLDSRILIVVISIGLWLLIHAEVNCFMIVLGVDD